MLLKESDKRHGYDIFKILKVHDIVGGDGDNVLFLTILLVALQIYDPVS
jgi:hypothetical protein